MGRGFFRKWVRLSSVFRLACALWVAQPFNAQQKHWEHSIEEGRQALETRNFELAEINFQAALDQANAFAPADPRKAQSLVQMARFYRALGDFARPEELYRQALTAAKLALGSNTVAYAAYKHEVAGYYHARRKYDLAEVYYKEAFTQRVYEFGREHVEVGESINDLGILYENKAAFDKALLYYEHALAIREKLLGSDHLKTIETVEHLARLLNKTHKGARAHQLAARAQSVRQRLVDRYNIGEIEPGEIYTPHEVRRELAIDYRVEPDYTDEARIARHEGSVVLQVTIDNSGRPQHFRLLRSLGLGLDEQAVTAVHQWRFRPVRKDGKRVAVLANLEILFSLM